MSQLMDLANLAESYKQSYESGQLSPQDFKELINDLNIVGQIEANASELQENQQYYEILMGVIQLAQMVR